ncbi:unnamed protein product [Pelagomonas calceolata]|uniref:Nucleotide-diphospho-sugar transferase domain-containing protein n=1 Tax=Pelagomonas calceolata TaxID=35677 RepID=A0A8J2WW75_9STRA|nr:unnamed protein product [Pelagomonas calceolata]|mmetsp:Transcript_13974/g.41152  ORF Transcript_13974/g.41152 Transcript_13974/m.41152 type:complete len:407 (+) Transcript_13974:37-1257(+)
MWKASLLLAAVRADFDDAMVAAGQRGQRRAHKAGPALLDVLRVPVRTGCALTYAAGNRTLTFRGARRISFDPAQDCDGAWPACGAGAPRTPLLCSLGAGASRPPRRAPLALATSVTDFRFLWRFWRWAANTACYASQHDLPYYVFVGTPLKRATKRSAATTCPARKEELLGHTSKALSLHALAALGVADRVLFLDADIWIARHVPLRAFLEAAGAADVALPAPCYRQLFGAAVVLVRSTPWAAGFLATWFGLRCGPKDQPSLWHLVLRAAGLDGAAEEVLKLYHDERCVVDGALTKNECSCVASGRVAADDATCGYYAAWKAANRAFLAGGAFPPGAVVDAGDVYAVRRPTFVEGGRVAYLPNVGSGSLLCGAAAPLRHVKFLRKEDRDLPAACPALPPGTGWKGD